jgi:hypothetical protein
MCVQHTIFLPSYAICKSLLSVVTVHCVYLGVEASAPKPSSSITSPRHGQFRLTILSRTCLQDPPAPVALHAVPPPIQPKSLPSISSSGRSQICISSHFTTSSFLDHASPCSLPPRLGPERSPVLTTPPEQTPGPAWGSEVSAAGARTPLFSEALRDRVVECRHRFSASETLLGGCALCLFQKNRVER